jgi:hypothetical protein
MIHLLTAVAAVAAVVYRVAGRMAASRLSRSALAGLAAAAALTAWMGTVRHTALVKSTAQPLSGGQKLSPGFILECGFAGAFIVVTGAVLAITAALDSRRARRGAQRDGTQAGRRARRAAVRGWWPDGRHHG